MILSKVSMDIHSCSRRCSFGKRPMLYFKNTYSTVCGALARQKQAVLSPSVAAHPFYCAVLLIVKSHKYRASCRACHALAYPFADPLLYILYVLSGAQAHRDHAEDVWRASAPWSRLARKRTVIMLKMSGAQAHPRMPCSLRIPKGGWGWGWAGEVA